MLIKRTTMDDKEFKLGIALAPVMIVDDEVEILKSLERELRQISQVECFQSPKKALEQFSLKDYSVVLSDYRMPEMSGIELLTECSRIKPYTQRILITAFSDLVQAGEIINKAKLNHLLAKPWENADLKFVINSAQRQYELARENQILRKLALTDSLTEVANRRYFKERMQAELSRAIRFKRPLTLILCDVDDFKKYNDTFGHPKGDEILQKVAQCLDQNKRMMDTVARFGGEEFAIILPEISLSQGVEIAKRHLERVNRECGIRLSLGVAAYPENADSYESIIAKADQALLQAKAHGKFQALPYSDTNDEIQKP